jgi:GR25 family glycosyltransferase involved in LPS biosynthesis
MEVVVLGVRKQFRGESLVRALHEQRLSPRIIDGVDSRTLSPNFVDLLSSVKPAQLLGFPALSIPEISCSAGHLYLYQWAYFMGIDWLLVLEDDVTLLKNPISLLDCISKIDGPVLISLQQPEISSAQNGFSAREIRVKESSLKCESLQRLLEPRLQTCSYLINSAAIQKLYQRNKRIGLAFRADWPITIYPGIKFFVTKEPYFSHPESRDKSLIYGSRIFSSATLAQSNDLASRTIGKILRASAVTSIRLKLSGVPFFSSYYYTTVLPLRKKWYQWKRVISGDTP